jgi:aspartyl-tRNA synthetase
MSAEGTSTAKQVNGATSGSANLPTLEELIAKYGDSSNTTWIEDKFKVWRHVPTGAAQGYAVTKSYCIIWGNPLCEKSQYPEVASAFLEFVSEQGWKPIWSCANEDLERYLAVQRNWRAVMCIQDDGLDPTAAHPEENKEVRKHIRGAQKKGCKIIEEPGVPDEETRKEIDEVIRRWKAGRKGTQVHTTNVEPWRDMEHRKYFYARNADGKVSSPVVPAQHVQHLT